MDLSELINFSSLFFFFLHSMIIDSDILHSTKINLNIKTHSYSIFFSPNFFFFLHIFKAFVLSQKELKKNYLKEKKEQPTPL